MKKELIAKKGVHFVLLACLPLALGWQKVSLGDYIKTRAAAEEKQAYAELPRDASFSAYQILEKATSAFYKTKTMKISMEAWFETPLYHIKSDFKSSIENIDNYKTDGQTSLSLLIPHSASSSRWVQSYQIDGIPFTWDLNKREWRQEELKISGKDAKKVLEYSVLRSLFTINEGSVDPATVRVLGAEKRKGRDCYVLSYKLNPKLFKRWNTLGDISVKTWIGMQDFLPVSLRSEGTISDMYILQIVDYSDFNAPLELAVPPVISDACQKEREKLEGKIGGLVDFVSGVQGWAKPDKLPIVFKDRVSLREFLAAKLTKERSVQKLANDAYIFKWLGLLDKDADYKESILNSEVSSIAALYEPEEKVILVGSWLHPSFAEVVLVHEIAHAFQDRNVGLDEFLGQKERSEDFDFLNARKSVVEGEATAIMLEYLLRPQGKNFQNLKEIFPLVEENLLKGSQDVRENIVYNLYGYGATFIQAVLRQYGWSGLNRVYRTPPSTMKQVIHPQRYTGQDEALQVSAAQKVMHVQVPAAWKEVAGARLGEFMLLVSLRQSLGRDSAQRSVSGWQRDQVSVYEDAKGQRLVLFLSRWDTPEDASEFFQGYKEWLKKRFPDTAVQDLTGREAWFKTNSEELFFCSSEKEWVEVAWSKDLGREEFEKLVKDIHYSLENG